MHTYLLNYNYILISEISSFGVDAMISVHANARGRHIGSASRRCADAVNSGTVECGDGIRVDAGFRKRVPLRYEVLTKNECLY